MKKIYGYVRVSTKQQSIERQKKNILSEYPNAIFYSDEFSGKTLERKGWKSLFNIVKENDTIVFDEVSRLSRNAKEGFEVYQELYKRGVNLIFLKEPHINTSVYRDSEKQKIKLNQDGREITQLTEDYINNIKLAIAREQIIIAFEQAQKERELLSQRTKEGLARAKANGQELGRPKDAKMKIKKAVESKPKILEHSIDFNGKLSDKELMSMLHLSRNTFYKYKRELKQNT